MKRSNKIIIAVVIGLGIAGGVAAKQFKHHAHDPEHRAEWVAKRISNHLDLNDKQVVELDSLKATVLNTFSSMHKNRPDFGQIEALLGDEFDQDKALQLVEQRSNMLQQKAPEVIAALAQFYATLNADQRQEISDMMKHRLSEKGRGSWHGPASDNGIGHE